MFFDLPGLCDIPDLLEGDEEEDEEEDDEPDDLQPDCTEQAAALGATLPIIVQGARSNEIQNVAAAAWCVLPVEIGFDLRPSVGQGPGQHAEAQIVGSFRSNHLPELTVGTFYLHSGLRPCAGNAVNPDADCSLVIDNFRVDYSALEVICTYSFEFPEEKVQWRESFGAASLPIKSC